MNPESGRRFGPYEMQSRLGGGGMGHVFRAWDARLHREVAIKLLNHEYAMPGMRERFLREARAASALNHPNICTIFDIGEQDGDPYLVMELLKGQTLKDRILDRNLQLEEIVSIARETAEALGAAHSKGVVHRDVKPANIFLVEKPNGGTQAKVLDFGLAKMESGGVLGTRGRSLDLTTAGATVGTLAYMSPEQARGEPLDSRSDLFSLGVVMYEMCTRQVPFQGATSALVFVQLLNHAPEPVRDWNDAIPRELEKVIFKLLAKERTARFQTAREVEMALTAIQVKGSGGGVAWLRKAVTTVPLVRTPDPVAREKRPRGKQGSGAGLAAAAASRPLTPHPAEVDTQAQIDPTLSIPPDEMARPSVAAEELLLRPVARIPRRDGAARSAGSAASAEHGVASTFSPVPPNSRPSTPSRSLARSFFAQPSEAVSEAAEARSVSPENANALAEVDQAVPPVPADGLAVHPLKTHAEDSSSATLSARISRRPAAFSPLGVGLWALLLILTGCVAYIVINHGRFGATVLKQGDPVVLTEVENRTGDRSLDGSIAEALRFALAQSPWLSFREETSYRAMERRAELDGSPNSPEKPVSSARRIAQGLGAKAYVLGVISGSGPYLLHIEVREVSSNDVLASSESHPGSVQEIPSAIDGVAFDLRSAMGEPRSSIDRLHTSIAQDASINLSALQGYAQAEASIAAHEPLAAVAQLQQALTLDPMFVAASLRLSSLYASLRAEVSAADAARAALGASATTGERTRTLAQVAYDTEFTGDYPQATALLRQLAAEYPHDSTVLRQLSHSLIKQGRMAEALTIAQQAYSENPFDADAYSEAEDALIGLDRLDAAFQVDAQVSRLGLARAGDSLKTADLAGHREVAERLAASLPVGRLEYRPDWAYGIYLDNSGRLAAGAALWRSRAEAAAKDPTLASAATYLLAQGALDRSLLGECTETVAMLEEIDRGASPQGRVALFNMAMAHALCGETSRAARIAGELQQRYPRSFDVNALYLIEIQAAIALRNESPAEALTILQPASSWDLISLTALLRGRAHAELNQASVAIVDFQTVLAHRGVIYLAGSDAYPAAEIGVARSFALSGDVASSAEAYERFLSHWADADPGSPLLREARAHARP